MTSNLPQHGLQLTSTVTDAGELELKLADAPVLEPRADQVVIRVEASPINPSDLGLLIGAAEVAGHLDGDHAEAEDDGCERGEHDDAGCAPRRKGFRGRDLCLVEHGSPR